MEREVGERRIGLRQGDITQQRTDAIVTAANEGLLGGGGVDGAVHRAAGPELLAACREIGGCPTGSAVRTPAFGLETRGVGFVIHAVGPRWRDGASGEEHQLRSAYRTSLEVAEGAGCASIAFPSISTGIYGFPTGRAAPIAVEAADNFLANEAASLQRVIFVLFDGDTLACFESALGALE